MNTGGVTVSAMRNTSSASFDMFARSAPNIMQERSEDAPKKSAAAEQRNTTPQTAHSLFEVFLKK